MGRLFDPQRLDHTAVGDVTFVSTDEGWLYLGHRARLGVAAADRLLDERRRRHGACHQRRGDGRAARGRVTMGGDTIFHSGRGVDLHVGPLPHRREPLLDDYASFSDLEAAGDVFCDVRQPAALSV